MNWHLFFAVLIPAVAFGLICGIVLAAVIKLTERFGEIAGIAALIVGIPAALATLIGMSSP